MLLYALLLIFFFISLNLAIELTFELPDNANQCFYEDIKPGVEFSIEYQVVTGGHYDVDAVLEDPYGVTLYKETKKQLDSIKMKSNLTGSYKLCFSNEFSTFSHKVIYMEWKIEGKDISSLARPTPRMTAMSQIEMSISVIADKLHIIDNYQTLHRLREATSRKQAEDLNKRVLFWSIGQTTVFIFIGLGQVLLLRSFFSDKKTSRY